MGCVVGGKPECHHTYEKHCKSHIKEQCTYEEKKVCSDVYEEHTSYQKKKECSTVYKTVAEHKKERKCKTTYKEECKPSYNYGQECKKIPEEKCEYVDVPSYKQVPEENAMRSMYQKSKKFHPKNVSMLRKRN